MRKRNHPSRSKLQGTSNKQIFEGARNKGDDIHYSGEISLAQILKDLKFPANKDQVVGFVRDGRASGFSCSTQED